MIVTVMLLTIIVGLSLATVMALRSERVPR
jgi:hypothetical protein